MRYADYLRDRAQDCVELARITAAHQDAQLLVDLAVSYELWAKDIEEADPPGLPPGQNLFRADLTGAN